MKKLIYTFVLVLIVHLTFNIDNCQSQWVQMNGPYGGNIQCFAFSGTNIFVGTIVGGVYLSTNNGTSWAAINNGLNISYISSLAVLGTNIFAGTDSGVFLSTNNGTNWNAVNNGLTNHQVGTLAVSGTNIFAGTYNGVFLSTNNGIIWTSVGLTNQDIYSLAVSGTNIYAGAFVYNSGVFLSTNNGTTWTSLGLQNLTVLSLAVSGTNIFAGTDGGVYLSTNNGTNWNVVYISSTNNIVWSFLISGTNIFAGTLGDGVFLSTNNGTNWNAVNNGLTNHEVRTLAVSGTNIFTGNYNGGGVFLSTNNGTSWTTVNNGLTIQNVHSLAVSGINIFAGTESEVYLSTNNGTNWNAINNGLTNQYVDALAVSGTNIFAGTYYGGVFLSTNNGNNWSEVNNGLYYHNVFALAISGTNIFAGTSGGVFLSTNNGTNWNAVGLTNQYIRALAVSGTNLFAGTDSGVFLSTNNGTNWNTVGLTNQYIRALAVSGTNLFAGTWGSGVFLSTNNGTNWNAVNYGLSNLEIFSLAVSGTNLFTGTSGGVFLSTNNGTNWLNKNQGFIVIPNVYSLLIANGYAFAGTYGQSVWSCSLAEILTTYSISGTVRYADNSQVITNGVVKAFKLNPVDASIIVFDTASIQSNGTYTLPNVPQDSVYIGVYPSSGTQVDYVITYYPSTIDWQYSTVLYPTGNLTNINISAFRLTNTTASNSVNGKVTRLTYSVTGNLKDAVLYAKNGNTFVRCAVSDVNGVYHLQSLPSGNLKIIVNRLGFTGDSTNVNVTSTSNIDSANFHLFRVTVGIKQIGIEVPYKFRLYQNYPNPFNPNTTVKFDLPKNTLVKLKIFNIIGREVTTLVNKSLNAGTYSIDWNASQYSSGVYFYKLETESFTEVKKMLMIK